ncbi:N-acetyltransferase [Actinobacteria bacterium YIM 96077]|uniref:GNAT family N-acetyltransferase n=1 Tax=Phytoactinopolyspora halophila TaxID=1981511 RepID=A0A329R0N2_9ACTN|nr:N-acetyltransferase [Actinobacteria bacterium YIM 96077]RAW18155.1 GNAT family N-acetyltransferase [Phytoactinopolyspora halophila]
METVALREIRKNDLLVFYEHQRDPMAAEMAAFPVRDLDAHLAHWAKIVADETVIAKTVVVDGQVAGNVVSYLVDTDREIGYWIGREFWGGGVATAAVGAFVDMLAHRPLYARVAEHNQGSIRVLEKCGFTVVGSDTGDDGVRELVYCLA